MMKLSPPKSYSGLILILLIYLAVTGYTSWHIPLSAGPDEAAHFMFARFLEKEGRLPFTDEDRQAAGYKSDQPPLNAVLTALTFWGDLGEPPFIKFANGVPRRHLVRDGRVDQGGVNRTWDVVNTEDPPAGEVLLWRVGRLCSTLVSGMTLVVIYFIALKTFERRPHRNLYALATVAGVAFIPTFIFISAVFSYEGLLGLWLSLYLLVAVHLIKGSESRWLYGAAGLFVGLAIVTKLAALPALASLAALAFTGYHSGRPKPTFYLSRMALSLLGVAVGAGWWFVLVEVNLNQVDELGWLTGLLQPILVGDGSGEGSEAKAISILSSGTLAGVETMPGTQVLKWVNYLLETFWFTPRPRERTLINLFYLIELLILVGLIQTWRQNRTDRTWQIFLCFNTSLFLILPLVRLLLAGLPSVAGQGHHVLFPAIGAWAILITWGLSGWFPFRWQPWLGGVLLGAGLLGWNLTQLIYDPPLPPVPVRTVPPVIPPSASPLNVNFGPMALRGYELKGLEDGACCQAGHRALGVNLYWVAQEFASKDYLTTVSLRDSQNERQSVWIGHGANGRYPTRAWEPGDIIRDEIWLPVVGLKPGAYTVNLEVGDSHFPLPHKSGENIVELAKVELADKPWLSPLSTQNAGQPTVEIWQEGQTASRLPVFAHRSTIQITAEPGVKISLAGPGGVTYSPEKVAGRTQVYVVDPLWTTGTYQLQASRDDQVEQLSLPALTIKGMQRQTHLPNSQITVKANFADQLMLLGYNLPQRHFVAGESVPLTLHWQALQTPPADFITFVNLRDKIGQSWGGYDRWPRDFYSTLLWVAGEVVEDGFTVPIDPDVPPGLYYLDVGFYLPLEKAPVYLPLVQQGQMSQVTAVSIGPIKIGEALVDGVSTNQPTPQVALNQPFGAEHNLTLIGYDLNGLTNPSSSSEGRSFKLTLYWRSESPLDVDYTTFVHLQDSKGEIVGQKDQPPLNGTYPTSLWSPGEIIADEIVVLLPPTLPAGPYSLTMGLYDLNTGARLPVPEHADNSFMVVRDLNYLR